MSIIALEIEKAYQSAIELEPVMSRLLVAIDFKVVETALIKPNWVNDKPAETGVTTDPRLVGALGLALLKRGVQKIFVAEGPMDLHNKVFARSEVLALTSLGFELIDLTHAKREELEVNGHCFKTILMPEIVVQVEAIFSFAKLKTHALTGVSLTVKNLFGLLNKPERRYAHACDINAAISDIYNYLARKKKIYGFVDGIIGLEGRLGPTAGDPVELGVIAASDDSLALDEKLSRLIGFGQGEITHLSLNGNQLAKQRSKTRDQIRQIGDWSSWQKTFDLPDLTGAENGLSRSLADRIFKKIPILNTKRCLLCLRCVEVCPSGAMNISGGRPQVNEYDCINCLCCVEVCREKAIDYRVRYSLLYILLKRIQKILN